MRVIALAAALIAAYMWRRRALASPGTRPDGPSLVVLALAGLLALWGQQVVFDWAKFWHLGALEWLPLGACVVGAVIGYILADQQPTGEQAGPAPGTFVERLFQASKGLAGNFALAALVLAAVVPSGTWADMIGRIQGVKAGSVELTLGAARGADLARDIAKAAPPRPVGASGEVGITERTGFVPVRLTMMQSYTYPPKLNVSAGLPGESEMPPEAYIRAGTQEPSRSSHPLGGREVRQVRRDRAIAWKLETSRAGPRAGSPSPFRPAKTAAHPPWIDTLGKAQEELLAGLAPHIECLSTFVKHTNNRRLVEYQNFKIVENLFAIAHLWSVAEKAYALAPAPRAVEPTAVVQASFPGVVRAGTAAPEASRSDDQDRALDALSRHIAELSDQFLKFGEWTTTFLRSWTARTNMDSLGTELDTNSVIAPCADQYRSAGRLKQFASTLASTGGAELRSSWFTPYLTVFTAQALSAMGDHASAIELLVQWMADLDAIMLRENDIGRTDHKAIADWYRLQVFTSILTLQKLSEGSDISIPQTMDGLRFVVKQYFPNALANMGEPASLDTWRQSATIGCAASENEWKQSIVLSFATWIKQYLDVASNRASRPEGMSEEDLQFALLLEEVNVKCFSLQLGGSPPDARFSQAEQHLQFVTTATAVRYYKLIQDLNDQTTEEHQRLRRHTEASLRSAMMELERAQGAAPGIDRLRALVYGSFGNDLLTNARNLQRRLEEISRKP